MKHPSRKSLGFQLMLTARLHRTRMAMLLGETGLFAGQEQALQVLAANDGATMGDLSRVLRVRPPTVSKTIARLSAQGLVERQVRMDVSFAFISLKTGGQRFHGLMRQPKS